MKLPIENKFLFKIMQSQILNRIKTQYPYENPYEPMAELYWDSITENGVMHIKNVKFPDIRWWDMNDKPIGCGDYRNHSWYVWPRLYADSIMIHHLFNDDYCEENNCLLETWGLEGPYGFENIVVEKGDVVIDAGAYIGDWSAVASAVGGIVYAFEPNIKCLNVLTRCSELNNFTVEMVGLGNEVCYKIFDIEGLDGAQHFFDSSPTTHLDFNANPPKYQLTTLDKYTEDRNIHVDFLKSDIEGYERFMIEGANRVLSEDEPKLAIRIYHNEYQDAEILPKMISKINPKYKMYLRKNTLFAYVD